MVLVPVLKIQSWLKQQELYTVNHVQADVKLVLMTLINALAVMTLQFLTQILQNVFALMECT